MKFNRRHVLWLAGAMLMSAHHSVLARSSYPSKPVKFIVPFAAGGGSDTYARFIAQKLNEKHGYMVIVDNRPGSGGNLGAELALREPADGYTFLVISGSYPLNELLNKPNFDSIAAIVPVVQFTREAIMMAVASSTPYKNVADFVVDAKKHPERVSFGSAGAGSLSHVAGELFNALAGLNIVHVPYKGTAAALTDLAAGQVQVVTSGSSSFGQLAKSGKVRPIAVAAPARLPSHPNVPTFAEQGFPNYRADLWHGLVASKSTPPAVVLKVNADINAVLRLPETQQRFAIDDVSPGGGTPQQFGEVIKQDIERWRAVIRKSDIKIN